MSNLAACFGTFDVRAIVGDTFNAETYKLLGQAFGIWLKENLPTQEKSYWVSVGYDVRLHSAEFADVLIENLRAQGIGVVALGMCPSPAVYFSEYTSQEHAEQPALIGTLTVTASHNPAPYNGLKFTFGPRLFAGEDLKRLKEIFLDLLETPVAPALVQGELRRWDILPEYVNYLLTQTPPLKSKIKVVVDSGNATGGLVAPELLRRLGCDVIELFSEPDGRFPNHHPDPCQHKNMRHLTAAVLEHGADFGVAFDGDSDRLGIVDNTGRILTGDVLMIIYAEAMLQAWPKEQPKPVVVSEVKCTQVLFDRIAELGGEGILAPCGHIFIKQIMREKQAVLGGELSGHFFFKDRYFGFDDAFYAALRFIEILDAKRLEQPDFQASDLTAHLPKTILSEEQRVPCPKPSMPEVLEKLFVELPKRLADKGLCLRERQTVDGLRLLLDDGFVLIRASNTEPCLTVRYEVGNLDAQQALDVVLKESLDQHLPALSAH